MQPRGSDNNSINETRLLVTDIESIDEQEITNPSFTDFTRKRSESNESIQSARKQKKKLGKDGKEENDEDQQNNNTILQQGTLASIMQEIDTMPDSGYLHKYFFHGTWYKRFRSIFLVSDKPVIHRLVYRTPVSVFLERSRHLSTFPNIIHPYSFFRWYWDILMTCFLLFTLIIDPIRMTFYAQSLLDGELGHIELSCIITGIYLMDILLNFGTGYVDTQNDSVNLDPKKITHKYLTSWFIVDFLSTIPFDLIYIWFERWKRSSGDELTEGDILFSKCVRVMDLFKLFRLSRAIRYIDRILLAYKVNGMYIRFTGLLVSTLFLSHWLACAHYLIPDIANFSLQPKKTRSWVTRLGLWNSTVPEKYVNCYFRSISLLVSIGISTSSSEPQEPEEIICSIINILIGVTLFACFIGHISSILLSQGVPERKYIEILNQVKEYLRFKQVPKSLQKRILAFYENRYQRNFFREENILASISDVLKRDLLMHTCRTLVENVPLFNGLSPLHIYAIVERLQFQVYLPLDVIFEVYSTGDSMYFIQHGMVSVLTENGRVLSHLRDGDFFGELALLSTEKRHFTVVATSNCHAYILHREDFIQAMEGYPEIMERIVKVVRASNRKAFGRTKLSKKVVPKKSSVSELNQLSVKSEISAKSDESDSGSSEFSGSTTSATSSRKETNIS